MKVRPRLGAKTKKPERPLSPCERSVLDALEPWQEAFPNDAPPAFGDDRDQKYIGTLYYRCAVAETARRGKGPVDHPHLRNVERELAAHPHEHPRIDEFRARVRQVIRETRVTHGCALAPPVAGPDGTGLHRLAGGGDRYAQMKVECAEFETTPEQLVALEVLIALQEAPEVFGRVRRTPDEQQALEKAARQACKQVTLDGADVRFRVIDAETGAGINEVHWRGKPTGISVDVADARERLVAWVADHA